VLDVAIVTVLLQNCICYEMFKMLYKSTVGSIIKCDVPGKYLRRTFLVLIWEMLISVTTAKWCTF